MTGLLIGYARVSTNDQDLTSQKNALVALGVTPKKTFTDQGQPLEARLEHLANSYPRNPAGVLRTGALGLLQGLRTRQETGHQSVGSCAPPC